MSSPLLVGAVVKPQESRRLQVRHPLFVLFLALFALSIPALTLIVEADGAVLLGFDFAAAVFVASTFFKMRGASPAHLRAAAARNDAGRGTLLLIAAITLLVVLVVVGMELGRPDKHRTIEVAIVVLTLTTAWQFGNIVYAVHYAHMFYDRDAGGGDHKGLNFPGTEQPVFQDFCYFAFVLGMTFQVSDVEIASHRLRRTATLHALVAFSFNIGVVALTVNVVASAI